MIAFTALIINEYKSGQTIAEQFLHFLEKTSDGFLIAVVATVSLIAFQEIMQKELDSLSLIN